MTDDVERVAFPRGPYGGWAWPCACDGFSFGHEATCPQRYPPTDRDVALVQRAIAAMPQPGVREGLEMALGVAKKIAEARSNAVENHRAMHSSDDDWGLGYVIGVNETIAAIRAEIANLPDTPDEACSDKACPQYGVPHSRSDDTPDQTAASHLPDCEHPRAPISLCNCPRPALKPDETAALKAEIAELRERIAFCSGSCGGEGTPDEAAALRNAVEIARKQFLYYEAQHRAKGTPDADAKAEVNANLAAAMSAALASDAKGEGLTSPIDGPED